MTAAYCRRAAAVAADHEVHRHQHGLEEHVEQEDVGGREDADHHRLEHQHQREVGLHACAGPVVRVVPGGQDHHRHQHDGHEDEDQRDAVHAHRVVHAERRDPRVDLGELVVRPADLEPGRDDDHHDQRQQGEPEGQHLGQRAARLPVRLGAVGRQARDQRDHEGAGQRHRARDGQPGKAVHSLTTSSKATSTAAPAEHGQGVRAHEAGLQLAPSSRRPADQRGQRVDQPVHAAVVEVHRQPGQPLSGPHEHRLVERVAVEVLCGPPRPRSCPSALPPAPAPPVHQPGHAHPGQDQHQRHHPGDRDKAMRDSAAPRPPGPGSPAAGR